MAAASTTPHAPAAGWAGILGAWLRHRRERHALLAVDERTLADLGLTRSDVEGACAATRCRAIDYAELEARRRSRGPRPGWVPCR